MHQSDGQFPYRAWSPDALELYRPEASRSQSFPSTAAGDMGSEFMRMPIALYIALATAAGGLTIETSPTPRTP